MKTKKFFKAAGIGILISAILSAIMVPLTLYEVSPFPKPVAAAFAMKLFGDVPMAVGILLHILYVTFWTVVYILYIMPPNTFVRSALLGLVLWVLVLVVFFPIVGWGFLGLRIGPQAIAASFVPHLIFVILLWLFAKMVKSTPTAGVGGGAGGYDGGSMPEPRNLGY